MGCIVTTLIVPAAGEGSRLETSCPKALVDLGGRPLIEWVVSAAQGCVDHVVVVIQPRHQHFFEEWATGAHVPAELTWAYQEVPTGSMAAVRIGVDCARRLGRLKSGVVIIWSDQVGVGPSTVRLVSESVDTRNRLLVVPVCEASSPYVWLRLDGLARIARVMRARDGDTVPEIGLADLGVFGLSETLALRLLELSDEAGPIDPTRELDFTYLLPELSRLADVTLLPNSALDSELIAVNTPDDLARARDVLRRDDD